MVDFVAVGFPGPFSAWGFQFLASALAILCPQLEVIRLDRYDVVDDLGRDGNPRLFLSNFPNPAVATSCENSGIRPVLLLDDLLEALSLTRAQHRLELSEALRPLSAGLVLTTRFAPVPGLVLLEKKSEISLGNLIVLIAMNGGLIAEPGAIENACGAFGGHELPVGRAFAAWQASHPPIDALVDDDVDIAHQVLGGLYAALFAPKPGDVTWPRRCFLSGDQPNMSAPVTMDITGRARILLYGPYFHLPKGYWTARVSLGFSHDIRGMPFTIQFFSTSLLGEVRIFADRGGIFSVMFPITVTEIHEPIELRIMNEQGAIEGHIGLASVEFLNWIRSD